MVYDTAVIFRRSGLNIPGQPSPLDIKCKPTPLQTSPSIRPTLLHKKLIENKKKVGLKSEKYILIHIIPPCFLFSHNNSEIYNM